MSNIIATLKISLNISAAKVTQLVGRPDDDTQGWYEQACDEVKKMIEADPEGAVMNWAVDEEVEVD